MRGGQDGVEVTLLHADGLAGLVDLGGAALDVALLHTSGPERLGTVAERGALDGAEIVTALGSLLSHIVARVGDGGASQKSQNGNNG